MDAHSLRHQGWSISAIARHLGRDRKTIRAYLNGEREPGARAAAQDPFIGFLPYCRQRLTDDPHLWATTLFDELVDLGYQDAYSTFTRALRRYQVRPHCEACHGAAGRQAAVIEHPAGAEIQFDWVELPDAPTTWGCGSHAHLLVGALAHSGRWRGVLAEAEDFAHFVEALDAVLRRLGATARRWRFDRMATVCYPSSGQVTREFAAVAKYYGVGVDICPPRRGNRKGVVEKANHSAAQRWWRTLPDEVSLVQAQSGVDKLALRMDERRRIAGGARTTVGALAEAEMLLPLPAGPYPALAEVERIATAQCLVHFRGNLYSVPPGLAGARLRVRWRLDEPVVQIATTAGVVIALHQRAPDGAGQTVRDTGHVIALERSVLAAFTSAPPCRSKVRRPPSPAALQEAAALRSARASPAEKVVIDLTAYAEIAARLRRAPGTEDPEERECQG